MPSTFDSILFRYVYCTLSSTADIRCDGSGLFGGGLLPGGLEWLAFVLTAVIIVAAFINGILGAVLLMIWGERRLLGRFQGRTGPNRWGPFGLLTPIADAVKTMFKEDVVPTVSDKLVFSAAPIMMLFPALLIYAVLPIGSGTWLADINVGLLFIIAIGGANVLAIVAAAWGSGNRYAMFSAMRAVAMLISYEIPLVISLIGVIMLAGSLSLVSIVDSQTIPYFIVQPLGFFVFLIASIAELNRTPF
ncbi:MAG: NADH-quinone oxidoreductase subunit H, partial [Chloroflexi bacterium]|nr:NADH-quinone oxidoreductase subunit H [Chloroflexota bacterium]